MFKVKKGHLLGRILSRPRRTLSQVLHAKPPSTYGSSLGTIWSTLFSWLFLSGSNVIFFNARPPKILLDVSVRGGRAELRSSPTVNTNVQKYSWRLGLHGSVRGGRPSACCLLTNTFMKTRPPRDLSCSSW